MCMVCLQHVEDLIEILVITGSSQAQPVEQACSSPVPGTTSVSNHKTDGVLPLHSTLLFPWPLLSNTGLQAGAVYVLACAWQPTPCVEMMCQSAFVARDITDASPKPNIDVCNPRHLNASKLLVALQVPTSTNAQRPAKAEASV